MEKLEYSNTFTKLIKRIYKNTRSITSNNGYLSNPFPLSRGVQQGCPLSLLIYVLLMVK